MASETARLIGTPLWNGGESVKSQGDTIAPMEVAAMTKATAVARR